MIYCSYYLPLTKYLLHEMEAINIDHVHETAKTLLDEFKIDSIECETENYKCTIKRPKNG